MTVVVMWLENPDGPIVCAADTRLSGPSAAISDCGPKLLAVPVITWSQVKGAKFAASPARTFGFAFAGSSLAALGTHALATACTQNIVVTKPGNARTLGIEDIARIFARAAEHWLQDAAWRTTTAASLLFESAIFGYCRASNSFRAFAVAPQIGGAGVDVRVAEMIITPTMFHVFGSGRQEFLDRHLERSKSKPNARLLDTLSSLVREGPQSDVGGFVQLGAASRNGYIPNPVITEGGGPNQRVVSFVGWDTASVPLPVGYRVGFHAWRHGF